MNKLNTNNKKKYFVLSLTVICLVLTDQISKYFAAYKMNHNKNYTGIKHIISFEYLENRGVAFGFLAGRLPLITMMVVIISLLILYAIHIIEKAISECHEITDKTNSTNDKSSINNNTKSINKIDSANRDFSEKNELNIKKMNTIIKKYTILQIICTFLIAGSIGNMIDRIRLGYVIDFIKFDFIDFPIFNIADCYVTVSVFILLIMILFFISEDELQLIKIRK